jgi:hypothetical protein
VDTQSSEAAIAGAPRRSARAWLAWSAVWTLAAAGLFVLYLRQAQTWKPDADAAAIALQAQEMLHGNLLLHGWWLADVTFYTTELPEYMLVGAAHGFSPGLVSVCAALTYTLLVVLAALLAKGRAGGREGIARALLAAGIMLSPGIFRGTNALLESPDHTGTGVPALAILLLLDRAEDWRRRWPVPVAVGLLLAWVQVADLVTVYAVAVPLALVSGGRAIARRRGPRRDWLYELSLVAAAAGSVPLGFGLLDAIRAHGGFTAAPVPGPWLSSLAAIPSHALAVGESVLVLFGADFFGQPTRTGEVLAFVHLAGVAVAALALLAGVGRFFGRLDRVTKMLVAGTLIVLAAGVFSTHVPDVTFAHEIAIVLPFGAALAGRMLGGPLVRVRLRRVLEPVLAAVLAAYLGALCYAAVTAAPEPPQNQLAADWLVAHGFTYGLAGYWQADSITFDTGGRVRVAPLIPGSTTVYHWEANAAWYDPRSHYANFVITEVPSGVYRQAFGKPAHVYHYLQYTIMVWRKNLLNLVSEPAANAALTETAWSAGSHPRP